MTLPEMGACIVADGKQNDHCTAHPIFLVQSLERTYGIDVNYDPDIAWVDSDGGYDLSDEDAKIAEAFYQENGEEPRSVEDGVAVAASKDGDKLERVGYVEHWDFLQPFFTRQGAEAFIKANSHNYRRGMRVYVDSAHRNYEWQAVREYLASTVIGTANPFAGGDR